MLTVISPAKSLNFNSWESTIATEPQCLENTAKLIGVLNKYAAIKLGKVLGVSKALGQLNYERFQSWNIVHDRNNSKPAILAYDGDIYKQLKKTYDMEDERFLQEHLRIISGFYGLLRPFDLIQPYRLEMKVKLKIGKAKNLYEFWRPTMTNQLNKELKLGGHKYLINLASDEYSDVINPKTIQAPVINIIFRTKKGHALNNVTFFSKKARGMVIDFMTNNKIDTPEDLKEFNYNGYKFFRQDGNDYYFVN